MLLAEGIVGNVADDPELAARIDDRDPDAVERLVLDERERRRSRIRTTTDAGTDVGIVVRDERGLRPGDVLVDDPDRTILVAFADREALVVSLEAVEANTDVLTQVAALGYQIGNRHWDLAVRDGELLVALGADGERKIATLEAALPPGARTRREAVDPTLFDGTPDHTHDTNDHDHAHQHAHVPETGVRSLSVDDPEDNDA